MQPLSLNKPALIKEKQALWGLIVLATASLFLTTLSNRLAAALLESVHFGIGKYAQTCIPSVIVAMAVYLAIRPAKPFGLPNAQTPWKRVLRVSAIWISAWLACSLGYSLWKSSWDPYVVGIAPVIGFLIFGPLGEELLFRGAIFELTERAFPGNEHLPVVLSTLLFSAHHLQLHGFSLTKMVLIQVAFTLPMGLVFGRLRKMSGSIWPGVMIHMLTNFPHAFKLF